MCSSEWTFRTYLAIKLKIWLSRLLPRSIFTISPSKSGSNICLPGSPVRRKNKFKSLLVLLKKLCPHLYALTLVCSSNLIVEIAPYSDILCLNGWTYNSLPLIIDPCTPLLQGFLPFYVKTSKIFPVRTHTIHPSFKNLSPCWSDLWVPIVTLKGRTSEVDKRSLNWPNQEK